MDGMSSAIRNRRGGGMMDQGMGEAPMVDQAGGTPQDAEGLKGLVSSLDESQKALLLNMLVKDQSASQDAPAIEQGKAGPGEEMEVEEYVSSMEPEEGHESEEEIMESMISSADKSRAADGVKPRNLGERMKVGLANKLKKKG